MTGRKPENIRVTRKGTHVRGCKPHDVGFFIGRDVRMTLELPIPEEGESQPEFAIRFHTTVGTALPTDERNAQCFRVWRDVHGPTPEDEIAEKAFPADKYRRVRDVAIFDEHETPRDKYRRDDLVGILNKQNSRIRNRSIFCPISDGHTSDDVDAPEPTTLGYMGALKLGMVGNENPTWCLFADEYHHLESVPVLDRKRGRSVETYRFDGKQKFIPPNQRYFYPVAALGSTEPRLQLPPARYQADRTDIERYMMPGGSNSFIPGDVKPKASGLQKYGEPDGDEDDFDSDPLAGLGGSDRQIVQAILKALMESDVVQEQIAKAEMQNGMGSVGPRIPNVINPAQAGQQPGMPGAPGQPGQVPGQQQMPGQMPPGQPQKPNPMNPASGQQAGAAQMPGTQMNGQPNKMGDKGMSDDKAKYSSTASAAEAVEAANARIAQLEETLKTVADQLAEERSARVTGERYSRLATLAGEFALDMEKEKARAAKMTPEQFEDHVGTIKECYRRKAEGVRDFSALAGGGDQRYDEAPEAEVEDLPEADVNEIVKYAAKHTLGYAQAKERYMAERKK